MVIVQDQVFLGRDIGRDKDYSEEVAAKIDKEIRKFIDEAYQKTESLLNENMDKLHLIADALIERETLEGEEIDQLMKYGKILSKEENTSEMRNSGAGRGAARRIFCSSQRAIVCNLRPSLEFRGRFFCDLTFG